MFHVYVLKLKEVDAYYVGQTQHLPQRIKRHIQAYETKDARLGAAATRKYGVERLAFLIPDCETREIALATERQTIHLLRAVGLTVYGG